MTNTNLGVGAEFDRIRDIADALGDRIAPIGDDTAVVPPGSGELVVSTDTSVEGVHFRRDWLRLEEIGWRATAAALSDLAAAGASVAGVVVAVTVPRGAEPGDVVEVMRGAGDVCAQVGGRVLGGDLTAGDCWSITVTVLGYASPRAMSRRGATPGNGVWVTGALGGARAALVAWNHGQIPDPAAHAAFAHPEPRIAAGKWLAQHGATAMLDVSDGFAGDVRHLAAASSVTLDILLELVPVHRAAIAAAHHVGEPPAAFAAVGGEDYELLVAMPDTFGGDAEFAAITGLPLTRIGSVIEGNTGVRMTLAGQPQQLAGYVHRL